MTSFVNITSNSGQAEDLARSTSYQALQTDKNAPKNYDTTKLEKSGRSWASIAVELLMNPNNLTHGQPRGGVGQGNWLKKYGSKT